MRLASILILIAFLTALTSAQASRKRTVKCMAAGAPLGYRIIKRTEMLNCTRAYLVEEIDKPESEPIASPTPEASPVPQTAEADRTVQVIGKVDWGFERSPSARQVVATDLKVTVKALVSGFQFRILPSVTGKRLVLSVPVEIRNSSPRTISMMLSHEWYGGLPVPTDLGAAAFKKGAEGMIWQMALGYQVGELGTAEGKTVLGPGQTKTVDIRLNWPGTGSVPMEPLIDGTVSGRYPIRFMLFFTVDGRRQYVESDEATIEVKAAPLLFEVSYALDDKDPSETSHATRTLWISSIQLGQTYSKNRRYGRIDDDAEKKAAECVELLLSAVEPAPPPDSPTRVLTVRARANGSWMTKRFSMDIVPEEIRHILTILGIYEEDLKRFRFTEDSGH